MLSWCLLCIISTTEEAMTTEPIDDVVNEPRTEDNLLDLTAEDDLSDVSAPPSDILDSSEDDEPMAFEDDRNTVPSAHPLSDFAEGELLDLAIKKFRQQSHLTATHG